MPREKKTAPVADGAAAPGKSKKRKPRPIRDEHIVPLTGMKSVPLGYRMMAAAHTYSVRLGAELRRTAATATLSVPQLQALQLLAANSKASSAELARAMGVQPQTMTSITSCLRRDGLIESSRRKGLIQDLTLTEAGTKMLAKGRAVVKKVDAQLSGAYSYDDKEAEVLADLLTLGHSTLLGRDG